MPAEPTTSSFNRVAAAAATLTLAAALSACGGGTSTTSASTGPAPASATAGSATGQAAAVKITDPWVKAVDTGMTGAFFSLTNGGSAPVHVVSASSPIAPMIELHETTMSASGAMQMQEKKGGFTIAPAATHVFQPGGDHVMLMGVTAAVKSGTTLTLTLKFEDGTTLPITAEVRTFAGAKETYVPGATHGTNSMPTSSRM